MSATRQPGTWRPDVPSILDGRYLIEGEIEALAYGFLYAARDTTVDEPVAITVFHPAFFAAAYRKRNLARVRRALRYQHPNLAAVRHLADEHDPIYVVADPVVGQPLTLWRREGRDAGSATEAAYRVIGQLLDALAAVHCHGVHGAIGPSTVRIAGDDIWLSNPWHLDPPAELAPGELPSLRAAWLAPEQLYDVAPEGPATDVYASGLVLGFLLARGLTEPGHSLMVQGLDVPPPLDEVYVRATARQPELRYASVTELRHALATAIGPPWVAAQAALAAPVYELVLATRARAEGADAVFVGVAADAPVAHPSTEDTPFDGIPMLSRTLVDGEFDMERTVEEEAIPAEILAVTATAEALAVPLDASGIVDAREIDESPGDAPPPLPGEVRAEAPDFGALGVEVEAVMEQTGAAPPPLPPDAEWIGPPSPGDTVPSDTPPIPVDLTPPPRGEAPGTHDTGERLAVAAGGESWVLEARKLSEAVRSGRPIEASITRLPSDKAPPTAASAPAVAPLGESAAVAVSASPPPLPPGAARVVSRRSARPAMATGELTIEVASGMTESIGSPRADLPGTAAPVLVDVPLTRSPAPRMVAITAVSGPTRRGRRGLWVAAAAFLVLGGLAAALLFGGEANAPAPAPPGSDASAGVVDAGPLPDAAGVVAVAAADIALVDTVEPETLAIATGDEDAESTAIAANVDADAGVTAEADAAVAPETLIAASDAVIAVAAAPDTDEPPPADTVTAVVAAADTTEPAADTATAAAAFVPTDWRALDCPGGMAKIRRKIKVTLAGGAKVDDWEVFCVDRYEAPGSGQPPTVDIDFASARSACSSSGKRLCTRSEWRGACGARYPYGRTYDPDACNTVGSDGMPRPVLTSGSKAGCKSGWGTHDMVGNVAEWTSDGTVNGGSAYKHGESATCYQSSRRAGGHPYVGYRCCADAR